MAFFSRMLTRKGHAPPMGKNWVFWKVARVRAYMLGARHWLGFRAVGGRSAGSCRQSVVSVGFWLEGSRYVYATRGSRSVLEGRRMDVGGLVGWLGGNRRAV